MSLLQSSGALEHYTSLREEVGRAEAEVEGLRQRLEAAERIDPVMAVLAGKLEARRSDCAPLAGKSTLNRLELSRPEPTRYAKISADTAAIARRPNSPEPLNSETSPTSACGPSPQYYAPIHAVTPR